jgi:limonene-1,2-epoxide hydrolase
VTHVVTNFFRCAETVIQYDFAKTGIKNKGGFQMKIALSLLTAAVVPFGFVVLAIAAVGYVLAKRREAGAIGQLICTVTRESDRAR